MTPSPDLQVYQVLNHADLEPGLLQFCETLEKIFRFSALGVMKHGWSSPKGDWTGDWHCPEVEEIKDFFWSKLPTGDWNLQLWFNVLSPGGSIKSHNHAQAELVAVYHISGPGDLLVEREGKGDLLAAIPGRMAVFPGILKHSVPLSTERRVSLAINAHRKGQKVVK